MLDVSHPDDEMRYADGAERQPALTGGCLYLGWSWQLDIRKPDLRLIIPGP
jgi:hypothetical protein